MKRNPLLRRFIYCALAIIAVFSCARDAEVANIISEERPEIEFVAQWADNKPSESRTAIQEDGTSIWWNAGEEINVFFASGAEGKFTSTNTEAQATATFRGTISGFVGGIEQDSDTPTTWAVYPYSADNCFDGNSVTLTLPSEQHATEGTFADKFFPAIARTQRLDLAFYNVCGGVRFSVSQPGITSILFQSNDGSPMAGRVKVGFGSDNKPEITEVVDTVSFIKAIAPDGGFVPGNYYFAAMIPQAHMDGIAETFSRGEHVQHKGILKSITVKRSVFGKLDDMDNGLVTGVILNKSELEIEKDETAALQATVSPSTATDKSIEWTSSNPLVARVSAEGVVNGVGAGTAVITATTVDGGFRAKCEVKVILPMTDLGKTFVPVDLGLSVKWASYNLGAANPEEHGDYIAWGETESKADYSWSTYKWCINGNSSQLTKYCNKSSYGYNGFTDGKTILDSEDDAASVALGGSWRIPTDAEWTELRSNCKLEWTTLNGVKGHKVTGNKSGYTDRWIFLPAAGCLSGTNINYYNSYGLFWSSSIYTPTPSQAWDASFKSYGTGKGCVNRSDGRSIRPVTE